MDIGLDIYAILFLLAGIAGFIDAIAGGGGLITIPALLAAGLPPAAALATNKLQASGGSFSASLYFVRKKAVDLRTVWKMIIGTFSGAMIGTIAVQLIDASVIKSLLPILVLVVGLYFLFSPKLGEKDCHQRLSFTAFALAAAFPIGFYDGFFGPGTGSFLCVAFVTLLGFNLSKATAHAKILNFTSNFTSLIFFILGGEVYWTLGFVMMIGGFLGARLGAKMVLTKGQKLIRPMVVIMAFIMTAKMMYDYGWFN
ncbi:TSUP family transporter [Gallibacterium anatis]|uniref:TSUP family transporter n=1 Tax=Gallibacterium anatis TaxID=750 RepID=UPI001B334658|nr:TSUP family transporter [Gallibacterium anatis]MBP4133788.1 TSUP family transporter [Gallibacterium anatis]